MSKANTSVLTLALASALCVNAAQQESKELTRGEAARQRALAKRTQRDLDQKNSVKPLKFAHHSSQPAALAALKAANVEQGTAVVGPDLFYTEVAPTSQNRQETTQSTQKLANAIACLKSPELIRNITTVIHRKRDCLAAQAIGNELEARKGRNFQQKTDTTSTTSIFDNHELATNLKTWVTYSAQRPASPTGVQQETTATQVQLIQDADSLNEAIKRLHFEKLEESLTGKVQQLGTSVMAAHQDSKLEIESLTKLQDLIQMYFSFFKETMLQTFSTDNQEAINIYNRMFSLELGGSPLSREDIPEAVEAISYAAAFLSKE